MTASEAAQRPPAVGRDLTDFPVEPLASGRPFQRAHRTRNDVWYFSSGNTGRFDLDPPDGTCYLADDTETAVREHLRDLVLDRPEVSETRAREFQITEVTTVLSGQTAQISTRESVRFGVTRELGTMVDVDYAIPRAWARAFAAIGRVGVRYASRFTTAAEPNAWGLFSTSGGRASTDPEYARGGVLDGVEGCRIAGIAVLPIPATSARLTVL